MCGRRKLSWRTFGERLAKLGLALHPDKTRLIELGRFAVEKTARTGAGQTGNVRLPGLYALLWNGPSREVPGRTLDGQEAHASDADRDPGQALPTAARIRACGWCVASTGPEWLLCVPRSSDEPAAVGWLSQRGMSRLAACAAAPKPTEPAQLVPFQSTDRKYVPPCRVLHPYPEQRFLASRP